ncbi:MAG TPA: ankyrin repeat domain-containing protein [Blastocatellia bacterium]|nr:ankyrin repeat domain-containing protein [Blastocatellia bacterium]
MEATELAAQPTLDQYENLAADVERACNSGSTEALRRLEDYYKPGHPLTADELRERTRQQLSRLSGSEHPGTEISIDDARLLVAHSHGFESWPKLAEYIDAMNQANSSVSRFEAAVEAVISGDLPTLGLLLREDPQLINARSMRSHHATLLHYVGANGVEDYRQKTPKNAVEVAKLLLEAGAEVNSMADMYRGSTTLGLVATSVHPMVAGVQIPLLELLLERGARIDDPGQSAVNGCLANGRGEAAAFLAERGARLDLEGAAGVGRLDVVRSFFNADGSLKENATPEQLRSAFAWACQFGRTKVVEFLLGTGFEMDTRLRHDGQTGLHWAAYGGHAETVELLLNRGAPIDARDESYEGTALEWALYGWGEGAPEATRGDYYKVVSLLVSAGAKADKEWLTHPYRENLGAKVQADARMLSALSGEIRA